MFVVTAKKTPHQYKIPADPPLTRTMPGSWGGNGNGHRSADSCESCSEAMKSKPVYSELSGYGAALRVSEVTSHPV